MIAIYWFIRPNSFKNFFWLLATTFIDAHRNFRQGMDLSLSTEIVLRVVLLFTYGAAEYLEPRYRPIHREEWWLYRNPRRPDIVPIFYVKAAVLLTCLVLLAVLLLRRSKAPEMKAALLGFTLSVTLNGCITDIVKNIVGRPRPDFFYRCHPKGLENEEDINLCTGRHDDLIEGRKSFPSGHSSIAFSAFFFLSLLLLGQFAVFARKARRFLPSLPVGPRLCLGLLPALAALCVALSRMVDFHHHVEDVFAGSFLGSLVAYMSYRIYFPSLFSAHPELPNCALDEPRAGVRERLEV